MPARAEPARCRPGVKMPLSPTMMRSFGTRGARRSLTASVVSKVRRSRLLMPIEARRELQRPVELGLVVDLDQHVHAESSAASSSVARVVVADRRHDDQDAVGAERARLVHLIGLVHEILAEHRQVDGRARGDEVLRRALEERRVGEHREAGRAARLVGAGERRRIEVGADQALRRARLLDLGDQRRPAGGDASRSSALRKPRGGGSVRGAAPRSRAAARRPWRRRSPRACSPRSSARMSAIDRVRPDCEDVSTSGELSERGRCASALRRSTATRRRARRAFACESVRSAPCRRRPARRRR